jgi:hypothetical protein
MEPVGSADGYDIGIGLRQHFAIIQMAADIKFFTCRLERALIDIADIYELGVRVSRNTGGFVAVNGFEVSGGYSAAAYKSEFNFSIFYYLSQFKNSFLILSLIKGVAIKPQAGAPYYKG